MSSLYFIFNFLKIDFREKVSTNIDNIKMYEEAATGNPEAVERYENYLAARREAYHGKNRKPSPKKQSKAHSRPL
jgi:hypothetical protein